MSLQIKHLTGGYGQVPVIHDINLEVQPGEILGLIGLNGAGKSTVIKHVTGLLKPQQGEILVNATNLETDPLAYRQQFTYIPELPVLYEELTLAEHLEFVALAYQMSLEEARAKSEPLLKLFRLEDRLDWLPVHFSKGMKQKVMLVSALMVDVPLYVIDEPFLGLDPLATADFIDLLEEKKAAGSAILLSTHILANAEAYCDRFAFLSAGEVEAYGTLADLQDQLQAPGLSLADLYLERARREA